MTRADAALAVKRRYADYLQPAKKRATYICPLCGNGSGKDGDGMSVDPHGDGTRLKCFKCGFYGDIVDLYQQEHNCNAGAAFAALYERFDISIGNDREQKQELIKAQLRETPEKSDRQIGRELGVHQTTVGTQRKHLESTGQVSKLDTLIGIDGKQYPRQVERKPDFTDYYRACRHHIKDPAARAYLAFRGISAETAARYWLGYDPAIGFLIIPAAKSFYVARNTNRQSAFRYRNPTGASIELFNLKALDAARPVFVTEGAIDALSIIEVGGLAVALNSASNTRKLLAELEKRRTRSTLILCLDSDDAGRKAGSELEKGLRELDIPFTSANIAGQHKDPNAALTADRAAFIEAVLAAERKTIYERI